jgi:hypothetical protein
MIHPLRWAALGAAVLLPAPLLAVPITITNAGFEDLYQGSDVSAGAFPVGPAPAGWSIWDPNNALSAGAYVGVLNPTGTTYFDGGAVPEGDNAALLYADGDASGDAYGIEQQLTATLAADTTYTLTVEVGNIASGTGLGDPYAGFGFYNLDGFPGYRIELWAGNSLLAVDENNLPALPDAEGEFMLSTLSYTTQGGDPVGDQLLIRLINPHVADVAGVRGLEVDFDDVRLDAAPSAVPLPGSLALLLAGLPGVGLLRQRRCGMA